MFPGRLAAPRFVQYGQDFAGAPDNGQWVYVFFPGTSGDSAFFENNDQILLGRVPPSQILERSAYEFWWGPAAVCVPKTSRCCQLPHALATLFAHFTSIESILLL